MKNSAMITVVKTLLILITFYFFTSTETNAFQEGWDTSTIGTYVPSSSLSTISADEGYWILGDTVSEFPECGSTPHTAEILMSDASRALRLTSNNSNSECADNIWVHIVEVPQINLNDDFSIPLNADTIISFEETGSLVDPEPGYDTCLTPPCGDTVSLMLEDTNGNMLAYILQRSPGDSPNEIHSFYREIFLDPNVGIYSRNLFSDFTTIPDFNPNGATIRQVIFKVSEHGTATIDSICIDTEGCFQFSLIIVPDVFGMTQVEAESAIVAAGLLVGSVSTQNSNIIPPGNVISQTPVSGSEVILGTEVDLVISASLIEVPDVVGMIQSEAEATITEAELCVGEITLQNSSSIPAGNVIGQNPDAGTEVYSGTKVNIIVSSGLLNISKIIPSDSTHNDHIGISVLISNNSAIVGAKGFGYIFEKDDSGWTQTAKLILSEEDTISYLSVSISGNYAIMGANASDGGAGTAYIFERTNGNWHQAAKLTASDRASNDHFGAAVSIYDDYAIIGAWGDDDDGSNSGSVYIFQKGGNLWGQQSKLKAEDATANDNFGYSVSISEGHVIIGSRSDSATGPYSGSAYIFEKNDMGWHQSAKLVAEDGLSFGCSVSISGNYAIVGNKNDSPKGLYSGSAYIFNKTDTGWHQVSKLIPTDGVANDEFGYSVSISDNYCIVGGIYSESAYIFKKGQNGWSQFDKLVASNGDPTSWFGASVSISGDFAIVGDAKFGDQFFRPGAIYIFDLPSLNLSIIPAINFLLMQD
jgi:hypothetical protein